MYLLIITTAILHTVYKLEKKYNWLLFVFIDLNKLALKLFIKIVTLLKCQLR